MKYRVFVYIGSYRGNASMTLHVVSSLLTNLSKTYNMELEVVTYSANNTNVHDCVGCTQCFTSGICPLSDDVAKIKHTMHESDIIIIASPVYFHHISGSTKRLLDRLSYWSHILELRGKLGIPIAVEDTNGGQFAVDYLEKFFLYTGTSVLSKVVLSAGKLVSKEAFESVMRFYAKQIYCNLEKHPISALQEEYYEQMRRIMKLKTDESFEKKYWEENGLFSFSSFAELFKSCNISNPD